MRVSSGHLGRGDVGPSELQREGAWQSALELVEN